MTDQMPTTMRHLNQILENALEYSHLLLVPVDSGLELLDKDAGIGFLDAKSWAILIGHLTSLHRIQTWKIKKQAIVWTEKKDEFENHLPFIKPKGWTDQEVLVALKRNDLMILEYDSPLYPRFRQLLRSVAKSLVVTSGSLDGKKMEIQHTTISKGFSAQTLEDLTKPSKKSKRLDKK